MVLDNKLATAVGLVTGAYVSIFGLPGLNGKTKETVTEPTAVVQQADSSLLETIAQHVPELSQAHAGGVDNTLYVHESYELAKPVKDPDYPNNIRFDPYGPEGVPGGVKSIPTSGKCPVFEDGVFTNYFFSSQYHDELVKIFENDGYNPNKIEAFFEDHRNESEFRLFPVDGYAHLSHRGAQADYFMPLSSEAIQKILDL